MNKYVKWDGAWCVVGNGPTPATGSVVPVRTKAGVDKTETVAGIILHDPQHQIWIAGITPRARTAIRWTEVEA